MVEGSRGALFEAPVARFRLGRRAQVAHSGDSFRAKSSHFTICPPFYPHPQILLYPISDGLNLKLISSFFRLRLLDFN